VKKVSGIINSKYAYMANRSNASTPKQHQQQNKAAIDIQNRAL
jgi:hypothetical protein